MTNRRWFNLPLQSSLEYQSLWWPLLQERLNSILWHRKSVLNSKSHFPMLFSYSVCAVKRITICDSAVLKVETWPQSFIRLIRLLAVFWIPYLAPPCGKVPNRSLRYSSVPENVKTPRQNRKLRRGNEECCLPTCSNYFRCQTAWIRHVTKLRTIVTTVSL